MTIKTKVKGPDGKTEKPKLPEKGLGEGIVLDSHRGDVYLGEPVRVGGFSICYDGKSPKGNSAVIIVAIDDNPGPEHRFLLACGEESGLYVGKDKKSMRMKVLSIADTVVRTDITVKGPAPVETLKGAHAITAAMVDGKTMLLDYGPVASQSSGGSRVASPIDEADILAMPEDGKANEGPIFESQFFDRKGYVGTYRTSEGEIVRGIESAVDVDSDVSSEPGTDSDVERSPGFDAPDPDFGYDGGLDAGPDSGVESDMDTDTGTETETIDTDSDSGSDFDCGSDSGCVDSGSDCDMDSDTDADTDSDTDSDCEESRTTEFCGPIRKSSPLNVAGFSFELEDAGKCGEVVLTLTCGEEAVFVERSFKPRSEEAIEHGGKTITITPYGYVTDSHAMLRIRVSDS